MIKDPLPKELYDILACPDDKGDLIYTPKKDGLKCKKCSFVFPIKESIPILLPKEMQEGYTEWKKSKGLKKSK